MNQLKQIGERHGGISQLVEETKLVEKLKWLVDEANENHGGHFTIHKFTTCWRVGFGTVELSPTYEKTPTTIGGWGTLDEAISRLKDEVDHSQIDPTMFSELY